MLDWPLEEYAADFGLSGWDWEQRMLQVGRLRPGFIAGGHEKGLTPEQIEEAPRRLSGAALCRVRRSTRGGGYHAYVHVANIPTKTTRSIPCWQRPLGKISADTGRDFAADVDAYGAILFVWFETRSFRRETELRVAQTKHPNLDRDRSARLACRRAAASHSEERSTTGAAEQTPDDRAADNWDELVFFVHRRQQRCRTQRVLDEYHRAWLAPAWVADNNCYHCTRPGWRSA